MKGVTLKSRAVKVALAAGLVAFVLALLGAMPSALTAGNLGQALIPAIVCAALCWASAERVVSETAAAIDTAIARLAQAADGDLQSPIPPEVGEVVPDLSEAMASLFRQHGASLAHVQQLAMFDPVTGLPNRTHFRHACEQALATLTPPDRAALLFIDLDRFKAVNDTKGHAAGDMLLAMVADQLRRVGARLDKAPLIGRLAGDEFTMFLPDIGSARAVEQLAAEVLQALSEPFQLAGGAVQIGASIGIALRPEHGTALQELMRAADVAMYHAKSEGRGRAERYSDALAAAIADRTQLDAALREAITGEQFALAFQPQLAMPGGEVVAAEALLRWHHPDQGVKLPGTFIARAEETGMMVEIGDWVIDTVAATIGRWGATGVNRRLAVNVSARQVDQPGFFVRLLALLHATGAPPRLLELEVTETLAMRCGSDALEALAALRAAGVTIAIDDFGTGYTNLSRLREFPVDRIKLDRSLVAQVADRADTRAIVQALIGLIHGLGCEAVAEGVETRDQTEMLRVIGCDVIQGYAIAAPMDEERFLAWSKPAERIAV